MSKSSKRDEVGTLLACLLVSRKDAPTIDRLDRDYQEEAGESIPYRALGYSSLLGFLQSIPNHIKIERRVGGIYHVLPVVSEKIEHVQSLVVRQKSTSKPPMLRRKFRYSQYYPAVRPPRTFFPIDWRTEVLNIVRSYPDGLNRNFLLQKMQSLKSLPMGTTLADLEEQLQNLGHLLVFRGNQVCLRQTKEQPETTKLPSLLSIQTNKPEEVSKITLDMKVIPGGMEDDDGIVEEPSRTLSFNFKPAGCTERSFGASKQLSGGFIKSTTRQEEQQMRGPSIRGSRNCDGGREREWHRDDCFVDEDMEMVGMNEKREGVNNVKYEDSTVKDGDEASREQEIEHKGDEDEVYCSDEDFTAEINPRVKFRLEKLLESHPDGIMCEDLLSTYFEAYHIPLDYKDMGFPSLIELVAGLPKIFHYAEVNDSGCYRLFDAKKPVPQIKRTSRLSASKWDNLYNSFEQEPGPFPMVLPEPMARSLIPDGVMTLGESVGQILVTNLVTADTDYIEVFIAEVFTPSCFWLRLRKNDQTLERLMVAMQEFYEREGDNYVIPPVVMEKGLNCACVYETEWHRAIIKSVKPDGNVELKFYDFGTVKSYGPNALRFLHSRFSGLPAQAIPCGLFNVKPTIGDRWTRGVSVEFLNKVKNIPLIAIVVRTDAENNSMLVSLADTQGEDDLHINDWMVEQGFAVFGSMGDTIDLNDRFIEDHKVIIAEESQPEMNPLSMLKNNLPTTTDHNTRRGPPGLTMPKEPTNFASLLEENMLSSTNNENSSFLNSHNASNGSNAFLQGNSSSFEDQVSAQAFLQLWRQHLELMTAAYRAFLPAAINPYSMEGALLNGLGLLGTTGSTMPQDLPANPLQTPQAVDEKMSLFESCVHQPMTTTNTTKPTPSVASMSEHSCHSDDLMSLSSKSLRTVPSTTSLESNLPVVNEVDFSSSTPILPSIQEGYENLSEDILPNFGHSANAINSQQYSENAVSDVQGGEVQTTMGGKQQNLYVIRPYGSCDERVVRRSAYGDEDRSEEDLSTSDKKVELNESNDSTLLRNDLGNYTNMQDSEEFHIQQLNDTNPFKVDLDESLRLSGNMVARECSVPPPIPQRNPDLINKTFPAAATTNSSILLSQREGQSLEKNQNQRIENNNENKVANGTNEWWSMIDKNPGKRRGWEHERSHSSTPCSLEDVAYASEQQIEEPVGKEKDQTPVTKSDDIFTFGNTTAQPFSFVFKAKSETLESKSANPFTAPAPFTSNSSGKQDVPNIKQLFQNTTEISENSYKFSSSQPEADNVCSQKVNIFRFHANVRRTERVQSRPLESHHIPPPPAYRDDNSLPSGQRSPAETKTSKSSIPEFVANFKFADKLNFETFDEGYGTRPPTSHNLPSPGINNAVKEPSVSPTEKTASDFPMGTYTEGLCGAMGDSSRVTEGMSTLSLKDSWEKNFERGTEVTFADLRKQLSELDEVKDVELPGRTLRIIRRGSNKRKDIPGECLKVPSFVQNEGEESGIKTNLWSASQNKPSSDTTKGYSLENTHVKDEKYATPMNYSQNLKTKDILIPYQLPRYSAPYGPAVYQGAPVSYAYQVQPSQPLNYAPQIQGTPVSGLNPLAPTWTRIPVVPAYSFPNFAYQVPQHPPMWMSTNQKVQYVKNKLEQIRSRMRTPSPKPVSHSEKQLWISSFQPVSSVQNPLLQAADQSEQNLTKNPKPTGNTVIDQATSVVQQNFPRPFAADVNLILGENRKGSAVQAASGTTKSAGQETHYAKKPEIEKTLPTVQNYPKSTHQNLYQASAQDTNMILGKNHKGSAVQAASAGRQTHCTKKPENEQTFSTIEKYPTSQGVLPANNQVRVPALPPRPKTEKSLQSVPSRREKSKGAQQNAVSNVEATKFSGMQTKFFRPVEAAGKKMHLFSIDGEGWLCTDEFVVAFTELKNRRSMLRLLEMINVNITFKDIQRSAHPQLFSQLEETVLLIPKTTTQNIGGSLHLTPLKSIIKLLIQLKIVPREEVDKMLVTKLAMPSTKLHEAVKLLTSYKVEDEYWYT